MQCCPLWARSVILSFTSAIHRSLHLSSRVRERFELDHREHRSEIVANVAAQGGHQCRGVGEIARSRGAFGMAALSKPGIVSPVQTNSNLKLHVMVSFYQHSRRGR